MLPEVALEEDIWFCKWTTVPNTKPAMHLNYLVLALIHKKSCKSFKHLFSLFYLRRQCWNTL